MYEGGKGGSPEEMFLEILVKMSLGALIFHRLEELGLPVLLCDRAFVCMARGQ